jgi:hypothetical protein
MTSNRLISPPFTTASPPLKKEKDLNSTHKSSTVESMNTKTPTPSPQSQSTMPTNLANEHIFTGNIYLVYAFDIGDAINIGQVKATGNLQTIARIWPNYFKHYHIPLTVDLPSGKNGMKCIRANIHHFGVLSLIYKVPFKDTLTSLRNKLTKLDELYENQSAHDANALYKSIKAFTAQQKFFHHRTSYLVIHIDPQPEIFDSALLSEKFGPIIASSLRFETTTISNFQIDDILQSSTGYYRQDLVIIDTEAAFVYDDECYDLLDFFEFALIQQLELQYFDKLLDTKLDDIYEQAIQPKSLYNYLPFVGILYDPLGELSKLKVDISVITERLDNSIKLAGEAYYSEVYRLLVKKLELENWRTSVEKKLAIVRDVRSIYQNKINVIREDMLSVLIIILITIEVIIGLIHHR